VGNREPIVPRKRRLNVISREVSWTVLRHSVTGASDEITSPGVSGSDICRRISAHVDTSGITEDTTYGTR